MSDETRIDNDVDPRDAADVLDNLAHSAGRMSYLEKGALRLLQRHARGQHGTDPDPGRHRTAPGQLTAAELIHALQQMPAGMPVMISPEMGPGQASSARQVIIEHGHVWITGETP